jgi:hypothetical protein
VIDGFFSPRGKDSAVQNTTRPVCDPICLLFDLNRCSLPGFRATEVLKLRTLAARLKRTNLRTVSFPLHVQFMRGYLMFTLIAKTRLKLSKFFTAIRNCGLFHFHRKLFE